MQRGVAQLFARGIFVGGALLVPLRGFRVEVPAVVVNALARGLELIEEGADLGNGFAFKMEKAHNDVGNLNAGVVDVVLHVDFLTCGAEQTDERVAEDGVAQVADVGSLVGIDAGVFDELAARSNFALM